MEFACDAISHHKHGARRNGWVKGQSVETQISVINASLPNTSEKGFISSNDRLIIYIMDRCSLVFLGAVDRVFFKEVEWQRAKHPRYSHDQKGPFDSYGENLCAYAYVRHRGCIRLLHSSGFRQVGVVQTMILYVHELFVI